MTTRDITDDALDAHLRRWATAPAGDSAAVDRILSRATTPAIRRPFLWAGSGLLAAALAGGLLLLRPAEPAPAPAPGPAPTAAADMSFEAVHTLTPDEETYL